MKTPRFLQALAALGLALVGALASAQNAPIVKIAEPIQPKPRFSVDFNERVGEIRPINGINLWANMSCET